MLSACGNSSGSSTSEESTNNTAPTLKRASTIHTNQLSYLPIGEKIALIPNVSALTYTLTNKDDGNIVYKGTLSEAKVWQPAGSVTVKQAEFSSVQSTGSYLLTVAGVEPKEIDISFTPYAALHDAALKSYYYNRASSEITSEYGGQWARPLGHSDNQVTVHSSAASEERPAGTAITASKGWYDAGDFGKYVVNSGIATYTLMAAYQHYPAFYQNRELNIPESNDDVPDILNEIKWNLDWLQHMQDIDGGVYHKLTTLEWPGKEMPHEDQRERFVIGKSTAATLNFAATMAMASRVYSSQFKALSTQWLTASELAWQWANTNPAVVYVQPTDVKSGEYGDDHFNDEFAWAAAELYLATQNEEYLSAFEHHHGLLGISSWQHVPSLAVISLLREGGGLLPAALVEQLTQLLNSLAGDLLLQYQNSAYAIAMEQNDFVWGSNSVVLNKAMILMQAYHFSKDTYYRDASIGAISYLLGRNPTGYSFVTGFGSKTPVDPHHRASYSDNVNQPIPGMLVGGPQNGQQDECSYPSNQAALSYLDHWCSYSTNEVAINWNAPLVYVLAALLAE
ncbi:glycoside hydrolase family 9 [Thalassotalea sp. M1531]|uniref:Endoglucanase n=2 Tax=Thalassotalea algicola TaxID=2716224 RepID=A0A7Y0L9Y5_9GAMM|nr:glycoside hydrolase family 9 [Thalassotalea algicola]